MPATLDLEIVQGDTFYKKLTWQNPDQSPVDNTSYTALFQIRKEPSSAEPLIALNESGGIALGGSNGVIEITIDAATTADLASGIFYYELKLTSAGGVAKTLLEGRTYINESVAR